jgi:hypothetical protein
MTVPQLFQEAIRKHCGAPPRHEVAACAPAQLSFVEAVEKPLSGLVERNCQVHDHGIAIVGERTRQLMFARTTIMADRCRAASPPLYRDGEVPFIR